MAKEKQANAHTAINAQGASMEKLVSLCKRRGFIYQGSEIYGGLNGAWDYGPLGAELKKNIENVWLRAMTRQYDNIVGLDAAILMSPKVWEASGHVDNFTDPMVDCKACKNRFRADKLDPALLAAKRCPDCGGELTEPRAFNLMFKTHQGPVENGDEGLIYLRPETAQGIFVNFKNVIDTMRVTVPFGIAQVGKAFRNEITTKNFIFRTCEFEQMEMQFFVKPGEDLAWLATWKERRMAYYTEKLGLAADRLRFCQHSKEELAHYAVDAYDIQYEFPFGWEEIEGVHDRADYDLRQHMAYSGKPLQYQDPLTNEKYLPYVIETSSGLTRSVLAVLMDAYEEEAIGQTADGQEDKRTVLHFHPQIAPVTAGVFPLQKKDGLDALAKETAESLKELFNVFYDQAGAIGRRYRRMDEIGAPYCITIDYQTKEDDTVTVRFRDSMQQTRIARSDLAAFIFAENKKYRRKSL